MYPFVIHLIGPFQLNAYNLAILVGISLFLWVLSREKVLAQVDVASLVLESAIAGILGARFIHVISQWHQYASYQEMFYLWDGGLSSLGAVLGALAYSSWSLYRREISLGLVLGYAGLYAPLIHGFARIGCFLIGCCHGCPTTMPWGVTYTHPASLAPLNIAVHPTQLYSSLFFFLFFLLMRFVLKKYILQPGQFLLVYLMGISLERFLVDFLRGDRYMLTLFSWHQWLALGCFAGTLCCWFFLQKRRLYESV